MHAGDDRILGPLLLVLSILCLLDQRILAIIVAVVSKAVLGRRVSDYWVITFSVGLALSVIPALGLLAPVILLISTIWYRDVIGDLERYWSLVSVVIYALGAVLQPFLGIRLIGLAILLPALFLLVRRF